ncbi:MAG TPA: DUF4097 family beta strand repeat-containing protein [Gemmatimonadales bacterium]|nr:DUF4097 family beta strand repeat-containing protein [Gemmatimonadales bacterium]
MRTHRPLILAACTACSAALTLPARLHAQRADRDYSDVDAQFLDDCQHDNSDWRATYCDVRVSGSRATGDLITVNPGDNGGVEFAGWDHDSVEIHAHIQAQAGSDEAAQALAKQVTISTSGGVIHAEGPASRSRASWSVTFVVYVPRKSDLQAESQNGPIEVRDVVGKIDVSTENGPIDLSRVGGDVHARAENGPLGVRLSGTTWQGGSLDASTVNGPVDLDIPAGYNAQLETGTVNGPMHVDFPLTITIQGRVTQRISTTLGSGGPTVRVVTTNGPVSIRRR